MSRSLSLAAWLALRRGAGESDPALPVRPDLRPGERLIWVHCPDPQRLAAVPALAEALTAEAVAARIIATTPGPVGPAQKPHGLHHLVAPPEFRVPVRAFLAALSPDLLIWMQGDLRPVLLTEVEDRGLCRLLVDARAEHLGVEGGAWIPGAAAALVAPFNHAFAVDHIAAHRLGRLGLPDDRVEVTGALEPPAPPPACNERERRDLAQTIGPRPVWCAAEVPLAELRDVIAAHRQASRGMHRLLLILAPAKVEDVPAAARTLRDAGLRVASRWDGDEPEEGTEVYLADGPGELGLWFRLAAITYLGGTLTRGASRHPFEAAALGTAILHGGKTAPHAESFARLTRAGAARAVRSGQNLGHAVEALLAPDACATMVRAAWEVSTAGAVVANRIAEIVRARLPQGVA